MGADEEYLDNLLKSVTAGMADEEKKTENETISEEESISVEAMLGEETFFAENEDGETEEISINDLLFGDDMPKEEELSDGDTPLDIDAMLKELNLLEEDVNVPEAEQVAEDIPSTDELFYSNDLDADLSEINNLLEKADNNEAINDDILTMFAAADVAQADEEKPFDLMGEINGTAVDSVEEDKKAEKERKRKQKEEEKLAKKASKLAAKEQKKAEKAKKIKVEDDVLETESATEQETVLEALIAEPEQEKSAFDNFQEVDEFDDIEALLGSLNMEDLEFATAPVENKSTLSTSGSEDIPSVSNLKFEEMLEESSSVRQEKTEDKKKAGWFKRFVDFLMEDDEEEETKEDKKKKKANKSKETNVEEAGFAELDKSNKKTAKGQKSKNGNKKGRDFDEDEVDEKKGKKKSKKPKKEKRPKSDIEKRFKVVDDGSKKVSKGGTIAILLLAASVFAVVMLANTIFSPMLAKQRAEKAFNEQDYETCYQELSGWDLSEKEAEMRDFARVVLKMDRRLDAYEQYNGLRQKLEAADSLMKAVQTYDELYQEALNCGAEGEVEARYAMVLELLEEEYGLNRKEAEAIAALESDVEYTRHLTAVVEGENIPGLDDSEGDELPGLLPEEEELPDTKFSE